MRGHIAKRMAKDCSAEQKIAEYTLVDCQIIPIFASQKGSDPVKLQIDGEHSSVG